MATARTLVGLALLGALPHAATPAAVRCGAQAGVEQDAALVERRLAAMGTWFDLRVRAAERPSALAASERALQAVEGVEARLSTWREDSELARLNRAAVGQWFALSPLLARDLGQARRHWTETDGAFDPGLGALVAAWGLRTGGKRPALDELAAAQAVGGFAAFELEDGRARRLHPNAGVEEGGFGKGSGLEAARTALLEAGIQRAVLDLGGQLLVLGQEHVVRLADPRERTRPVLELRIDPGSLATSGNSERGIVVDGLPRAHLLDPRSGEPATDFGSLSVWAPDAFEADCLSTGLYVLGPAGALAWQRAHPEIELVLLVCEGDGLRAFVTPGLHERVRALVPELELTLSTQQADVQGRSSAQGSPR